MHKNFLLCSNLYFQTQIGIICYITIGGFSNLFIKLHHIDPQLVTLSPSHVWYTVFFAIGWFINGVGVIGQPHIMVRAMAIDSVASVKKAQKIYLIYYAIFVFFAVYVGVSCRVLLPEIATFDPELALPTIAFKFLHPVLVGIVLAGIFSATMSTADSQILSCSAAFSLDLIPEQTHSFLKTKIATLAIAFIALIIALWAQDNIFNLVLFSWYGLAVSLGPLFVIQTLGLPIKNRTALAMILVGLFTAILWRYFGLSSIVTEAVPGIIVSVLIYFIFKLRHN